MMHLYHGSDAPIDQPIVDMNKGFADLGTGFYLTDDRAVAQSRARARARVTGASAGMVSEYEFDEGVLPWIALGEVSALDSPSSRFGLRFAGNPEGIAAWMNYIKACRVGNTAVEGVGEPAVVRAWIATEEVEMVCSGLVSPEELADLIDPADLVVQYCFRDQSLIDEYLAFVRSDYV